jgi:hypothetical protein
MDSPPPSFLAFYNDTIKQANRQQHKPPSLSACHRAFSDILLKRCDPSELIKPYTAGANGRVHKCIDATAATVSYLVKFRIPPETSRTTPLTSPKDDYDVFDMDSDPIHYDALTAHFLDAYCKLPRAPPRDRLNRIWTCCRAPLPGTTHTGKELPPLNDALFIVPVAKDVISVHAFMTLETRAQNARMRANALEEKYNKLYAAMEKLTANLVHLGRTIGFVHNDLYALNVIMPFTKQQQVNVENHAVFPETLNLAVIDLGRAYVHAPFLDPILSNQARQDLDTDIADTCMKLDPRDDLFIHKTHPIQAINAYQHALTIHHGRVTACFKPIHLVQYYELTKKQEPTKSYGIPSYDSLTGSDFATWMLRHLIWYDVGGLWLYMHSHHADPRRKPFGCTVGGLRRMLSYLKPQYKPLYEDLFLNPGSRENSIVVFNMTSVMEALLALNTKLDADSITEERYIQNFRALWTVLYVCAVRIVWDFLKRKYPQLKSNFADDYIYLVKAKDNQAFLTHVNKAIQSNTTITDVDIQNAFYSGGQTRRFTRDIVAIMDVLWQTAKQPPSSQSGGGNTLPDVLHARTRVVKPNIIDQKEQKEASQIKASQNTQNEAVPHNAATQAPPLNPDYPEESQPFHAAYASALALKPSPLKPNPSYFEPSSSASPTLQGGGSSSSATPPSRRRRRRPPPRTKTADTVVRNGRAYAVYVGPRGGRYIRTVVGGAGWIPIKGGG